MYIVMGGTGHVGSSAAKALLASGEAVTIISHDPAKANDWTRQGAEVAIADVHDTEALRRVFRQGKRLFLLNPPADVSTDTDVEEHRTANSIVAALEGSGLEKIVAESTYGARPGERCGDLNVLYDMEQALKAQPIPTSIIRAAYYMSNWDMSLEEARKTGELHTMFDADLELPMVAPKDLGEAAARLLSEPVEETGTHYVEGPQRYTPADVAQAFADALGRKVEVVTTPREKWAQTYRDLGFSDAAAKSFTHMTAVTVDSPFRPEDPTRGIIPLEQYIGNLVRVETHH